MPLHRYLCQEGHEAEAFVHVWDDLGCRTLICHCGSSMAPAPSFGRGLTFFEEGRPRVIWNMGPEPIVVTSHEEHKRLMKERQLEWIAPKRGEPGCWS